MRHGDALGLAGRPGREDDPRVVAGRRVARVALDLGCAIVTHRTDDEVRRDDRRDIGLPEDDPRPLVGVVVVDRDVGRARDEDAGDGDVEVEGARGDADADAVTAFDAGRTQGVGDVLGSLGELAIGEDARAVVDGGRVGMGLDRGAQDVDEGAWAGCLTPPEQGVAHVQRSSPRRAAWRRPMTMMPMKIAISTRDAAPSWGSRRT